VSVRLGTPLLVTSPHAWQTSSAMATMAGSIPELASGHPLNLPTRCLKPEPRSREAAGVADDLLDAAAQLALAMGSTGRLEEGALLSSTSGYL
jgi:hypothetical protein